MRRLLRRILAASVVISCATQAQVGDVVASAEIYAADAPARTVLVAFRDTSVKRVSAGPRMQHYLRRGDYSASTWSRRVAGELARDYRLRALADWPISEIGMHCVVYRVADGDLTDSVLARLATDRRVAIAQRLGVFQTSSSAYSDTYFELQHSLAELSLETLHQRTTGAGVKVAIIDTGVDFTHPDLRGQFVREQNFAADVSPGFEEDAHGTAVAGIIAARRNNAEGIVGIAPDARLLAYKACWQPDPQSIRALCNSFTVALALNTALRDGAQVINMSLGGPPDPLLAALIEAAVDRGTVVVAAYAADEGGVARFPATLATVIAVRSESPAAFAATGVWGDNVISAPGLEVLTTMPHGTYDFLTGSSFSAAHVSGLVALRLALDPRLSPAAMLGELRRHRGHPIALFAPRAATDS